MAINLTDIRQAVRDYLRNKVNVSIVSVTPVGNVINVGETFKFKVRARNANAENGGVKLKNVKLHVFQTLQPQSDDKDLTQFKAALKVPLASLGICKNAAGITLQPGTHVIEFTFDPNPNIIPDVFDIGMTKEIEFSARADHRGRTGITANVLAEMDLNSLFPIEETNSLGLIMEIEE